MYDISIQAVPVVGYTKVQKLNGLIVSMLIASWLKFIL
jgi:hypothetical protein